MLAEWRNVAAGVRLFFSAVSHRMEIVHAIISNADCRVPCRHQRRIAVV